MCKQSMMRWLWWLDEWFMETLVKAKRWMPMNMAITDDQCYTMQRWRRKNIPWICICVFMKKKTFKDLLDECGWISGQQAMTDASNWCCHWSSVTQCVVLIYLDFLDLFDLSGWFFIFFFALIVFVKQMKLMLACCDLFPKWIFIQCVGHEIIWLDEWREVLKGKELLEI